MALDKTALESLRLSGILTRAVIGSEAVLNASGYVVARPPCSRRSPGWRASGGA